MVTIRKTVISGITSHDDDDLTEKPHPKLRINGAFVLVADQITKSHATVQLVAYSVGVPLSFFVNYHFHSSNKLG
jgi:hypothetical protein